MAFANAKDSSAGAVNSNTTAIAMAHEEEDNEYIFVIELEDCATAASAISSPMDIGRQQQFSVPFAISPGKDSVIEEDTSGWNPNDAFNESVQLDESVDMLASSISSSCSSSDSTSYLNEFVRQMIASYPTEEQLAYMIAGNYTNYIAELSRESSAMALSHKQVVNTNENEGSGIVPESTSVQTTIFIFEQRAQEEDDEGSRDVEMP